MKIFAISEYLTFLDCLAYIQNNRVDSLTPGSEHLLKAVTYVTWHNKEKGKLS